MPHPTDGSASSAASDAGGKIAGGALAGGVVGKGLQRAAAMAGDVLKGIFGGLPFNMSPSQIIDAVVPGGGAAAGKAGVILPQVAQFL